ncbi:MAG: hypothetical protein ACHQAX_10010, partial [Gammaproteobacteria bacterium]
TWGLGASIGSLRALASSIDCIMVLNFLTAPKSLFYPIFVSMSLAQRATPTISSLRDMSVADLVASTGLSTESMTMNIRANVRAEYANHTASTYLPTRANTSAIHQKNMKPSDSKSTPN